jgi:hypothetical protein
LLLTGHKRAPGDAPIHVSVHVSAGVSPEAVVRHLVKVAGLVVSPLVQEVLQGEPLAKPQPIGYGPTPNAGDTDEVWEPAPAEPPSPTPPPPETSQEALAYALVQAIGTERAVDLLLRALAEPPDNKTE